ncbi:dormancy-associated protein homolog 3-like isoform X1 [Chenopodium quinoa]|uniref:dormancy-associated protein homolog 3-like isoform X1 n=1 Tax=Chenopodium quinoa TaxID=63459 RepID=UPI000B7913E2|nr:dormancy-associated protein homolog 3-like isoform X1 [Chenopodium quinoa]XP_021772851.1 dormancy-associated protein homolog 3-like isoform X1 [Chenopodium quinoa]
MGLLEKLWDDTLAGPQPDSGLGRLRKFNTFHSRSTPSKEMEGGSSVGRSYGGEVISGADNPEEVKVSRKIMIVKPPGYTQGAGSAPASPAGSTPPSSPFSDQERSGFGGDLRRTRMRRQRTRTEPAEALLLLKMSDI